MNKLVVGVPKVINIKSGEPFDERIDRTTQWGNPFKIGMHGNRDKVIQLYREWLDDRLDYEPDFLDELKGKTLACWCKPLACHGDVILDAIKRMEREFCVHCGAGVYQHRREGEGTCSKCDPKGARENIERHEAARIKAGSNCSNFDEIIGLCGHITCGVCHPGNVLKHDISKPMKTIGEFPERTAKAMGGAAEEVYRRMGYTGDGLHYSGDPDDE